MSQRRSPRSAAFSGRIDWSAVQANLTALHEALSHRHRTAVDPEQCHVCRANLALHDLARALGAGEGWPGP